MNWNDIPSLLGKSTTLKVEKSVHKEAPQDIPIIDHMNFIFRQIGDTYVVWLAPANRFVQLKEPAFRVLQDWDSQLPDIQIIKNCALTFQLPKNHARRFVREVISQLQSMISQNTKEIIVNLYKESVPFPEFGEFTTKYYSINGKKFRFRYGDLNMESLIHPGFAYMENQFEDMEADYYFDLFVSYDQAILQTDGQNNWTCPSSMSDYFVGLVYMQLLNLLHSLRDDQWMGAVHASAVTAGNEAVLFTGPSGGGKSTLAAMLMSQGYQVLSDDFTPISINPARVYSFPGGLSVKNRSLRIIQFYFPDLEDKSPNLSEEVGEIFLPPLAEASSSPAPVRAIVFVRYLPGGETTLQAIPSLEAMNRMLQQCWLCPSLHVASSFMDWYFPLPCYQLEYADPDQAMGMIVHLLES